MLDCNQFLDLLEQHDIRFSTGVPDSLLKDICACITSRGSDIIAANEGASIALATGYHLATGKVPFVYMQNSGFGNTINPITSLSDPEVYSIPMLIMVGWRAEPGVKDEPQHKKMGRINEALLKSLELPYQILSDQFDETQRQLVEVMDVIKNQQRPYVLLVKAGTFAPFQMESQAPSAYKMSRESAIQLILERTGVEDILVSTTGKASREVFESRVKNGEPHDRDFLTVGCMGHSSQIALGIALQKPDQNVICLDGDGAFIMHMGSVAIIGSLRPANYRHIVLNNGAHESVGGQPTVAFELDFKKISEGCGYTGYFRADSEEQLKEVWDQFYQSTGPVMLEVRTSLGARKDLGRPTKSPIENKKDFMKRLAKQ